MACTEPNNEVVFQKKQIREEKGLFACYTNFKIGSNIRVLLAERAEQEMIEDE
jgi:hypothetical protein